MTKPVIIGEKTIWLEEVTSTNTFAAAVASASEFDGLVVIAKYQTDGRGQRGNTWESKHGQNLTISIILYPTFIKVRDQFLISKVTALAILDTLKTLSDNVTIKWPNDIYIGNNKVAGILIENSFRSENLEVSIVGIGINVNQVDFSEDLPNPTSIKMVTGENQNLNNILIKLCKAFTYRYAQLTNDNLPCQQAGRQLIATDYFENLYRKDNFYNYMASGESFRAKIFGVRDTGELVLKTEDGQIREFAFKEVSFSGDLS